MASREHSNVAQTREEENAYQTPSKNVRIEEDHEEDQSRRSSDFTTDHHEHNAGNSSEAEDYVLSGGVIPDNDTDLKAAKTIPGRDHHRHLDRDTAMRVAREVSLERNVERVEALSMGTPPMLDTRPRWDRCGHLQNLLPAHLPDDQRDDLPDCAKCRFQQTVEDYRAAHRTIGSLQTQIDELVAQRDRYLRYKESLKNEVHVLVSFCENIDRLRLAYDQQQTQLPENLREERNLYEEQACNSDWWQNFRDTMEMEDPSTAPPPSSPTPHAPALALAKNTGLATNDGRKIIGQEVTDDLEFGSECLTDFNTFMTKCQTTFKTTIEGFIQSNERQQEQDKNQRRAFAQDVTALKKQVTNALGTGFNNSIARSLDRIGRTIIKPMVEEQVGAIVDDKDLNIERRFLKNESQIKKTQIDQQTLFDHLADLEARLGNATTEINKLHAEKSSLTNTVTTLTDKFTTQEKDLHQESDDIHWLATSASQNTDAIRKLSRQLETLMQSQPQSQFGYQSNFSGGRTG